MAHKVKICGLTRPEDVEAAIRYGASFLGFIVEATSPRRLSVGAAAALSGPAAGIIPRAAVTVNADDDLISRIMAEMAPDYIQCHGDETPARLAEISKRYDVKIIKAIPVATPADMRAAKPYREVADFILYDAKPPPPKNKNGEVVRGGHGLRFDWQILSGARLPKRWALAGGLTPANAAEAIHRTNAPILDVSSGVEASAGVKEARKIQAFMETVRNG